MKDTSNLALNTASDGASRASLAILFQRLTTSTVKRFFPMSILNMPSFCLKPLITRTDRDFLQDWPEEDPFTLNQQNEKLKHLIEISNYDLK